MIKPLFKSFLPIVLAFALAQPALPQQVDKQKTRRDVVTRYIDATNRLTQVLEKLFTRGALETARPSLLLAVERVLNMKAELKRDAIENTPEVQALFREMGPKISAASAKLANEVNRVKASQTIGPEVMKVLNKLNQS